MKITKKLVDQPNGSCKRAGVDVHTVPLPTDQILAEFNQPIGAKQAKETIQEIFARQVEETPEQIAVVMGEEELTYRQLGHKASQLARRLRDLGVGPEVIVGLFTQPSLEMFSGILGVLQAGGAYLPIDPAYPEERVRYMLADSQTEILLTTTDLWSEGEVEFGGQVLMLDDPTTFTVETGQKGELREMESLGSPENLAYVIYTSGSTGRPKGVMIENRSLVNLVNWHNQTFQVTAEDRAIKYAGVGFDASVWEIFPYLATGATIFVIPPEMRLELLGLNDYMEEQGITIAFLPTQFCEQFMKLENRTLRVLLTGGDKLQEYRPQPYTLVNNYGPTENTVVSTYFVVDGTYRNIPIGRPVANTQVYILRQDGGVEPVPIGEPGELCLAGHGIARGYLNRPELTQEKFIPNPFVGGTRMYRTGDLARWLPDGNIEFLGRIDHQVKIRGFRIELGEIENQLLGLTGVERAVVTTLEDQRGLKELVGYIVADRELGADWLRKELARELPDYMIPRYFLQINEIPLTANGKIDQKALPAPNVKNQRQELVTPRTGEEERMAQLWSEVLGLKQLGVTEHFLTLGGHSLHAIQLVARLNKDWRLPVEIKDIFAHPTIAELVAYLEELEESSYQPIPVVEEREYYPVSSNQWRLFAQDQIEGQNTTYNLPMVWQITGEWEQTRLKDAMRQLVQRHEGMRTYFVMVDGEPVQKIATEVEFEILLRQIEARELRQVIREFIRPFDLSQAPLFRVQLLETGEGSYLMMDWHHIITDGSSMDLWLKELGRLYAGEALPPLPIQYKDYSVWQQEVVDADRLLSQEEYWLARLADEIPVLELPIDEPRPAVQRYEGAGVSCRVGAELTRKVRQMAEGAGATLYMILLATYNVLLQKYSGQEDLIVGAPVAGRSHADLSQVFGLFVNMLPLRNQPRSEKRFCDLLAEVKDCTLTAFANQDYQYEMLVERLGLVRDVSRNPLFDVGFIVQNATDLRLEGEGWGLLPYPVPVEVAKFDLLLQVYEREDELEFSLEYSTHLFKAETIERMGGHLVHLLEQVVQGPERLISELLLEKEESLDGFNSIVGKNSSGLKNQRSPMELGEIENLAGGKYLAPRTEVERQLVEIWEQLLQVERIGIQDHFFKLGGHSMLAIKVVTQARALGWQIKVQDIFNSPTIQGLAKLVTGEVRSLQEEKGEDKIAGVTCETVSSYQQVAVSGYESGHLSEQILLTGVTGFLGIHLLEELVCRTDAEIYCLIRGASEDQVRERLLNLLTHYFEDRYTDLVGERIHVIPGDVTEPRWGLTGDEYQEMIEKIDTVVHAAALVKHFGDYAEFERVNVQGTARMIEFAEQAGARFHHISTMSVSGELARGEKDIIFTEKDFYVGQEIEHNVYLRSKFEAERQVLQKMKEGLLATIYRVGNLTGRYRDGQFQRNIEENAFYRLLRTLIQLQSISEAMMELPIEFTPIDYCSQAIVEVMQSPDARGRVFHVQNEKMALGDLRPVLTEMGLEWEIFSDEEFAQLVHGLAQDAEQLDRLSGLMHEYQSTGQERQGMARVMVDASWTATYLAKLGLDWPQVDRKYLRKIFGYMQEVGFI